MLNSCIQSAAKTFGKVAVLSRSLSAVRVTTLGATSPMNYTTFKSPISCRYFSFRDNASYGEDRIEKEIEEREEQEMQEEQEHFEEDMENFEEAEAKENDNKKGKDGMRGKTDRLPKDINPMDIYIRKELYPDLPEDVVQKLHNPTEGLPTGALLEDLPMFPNPFDHSADPDNELDPAKIRKEPYDFGDASVMLTTRDAVVPMTWEDEQLGPPRENRRVRLDVRVRDLNLPIVSAQKLVLLSGPRYNFNNDILTLTSDRYETRKQNGRYLLDLLENLIKESKKVDELTEVPRRLPVKRGKFLPFNKDMLGTGRIKKQYEGMITEDE